MRVYLSGPITDVDKAEEIFRSAETEIEEKLRTVSASKHHENNKPLCVDDEEKPVVINPINLQYVLRNGTHEEYMKLSYTLLDLSDAICMLPGWEKSKGSCMEYGYAVARGLQIFEKP